MRKIAAGGLSRISAVLAITATLCAGSVQPRIGSGWGIDASLATHVDQPQVSAYIEVLKRGEVHWVGERGVAGRERNGKIGWDRVPVFRALGESGLKVIAYAQLPDSPEPSDAANSLPEDLMLVYDQGRRLQREFGSLVAAWQMVTEADLGYCTDLPDRVAAYQKALYLGIRRGAAEAQAKSKEQGAKSDGTNPQALGAMPLATSVPVVLMGALGMPPGPWLERAAANGLLDYTDAYNFHFYGHAKDLTSVIEAHRGFLAKQGPKAKGIPLWITEAGLAAVDEKDFLNPERRQLQADFTLATAKQALLASDVAMFMPFILVHKGDPYALTLSAANTFPAWDAYAKFTRENPWPLRPLAAVPPNPNPIVVQWLPDNQTCLPHKVSGTYRFRGKQPIRGELRIYNFGITAAKGRIEAGELEHSSCELGVKGEEQSAKTSVIVPAMGMVSVPLEFAATAPGYFREIWTAAFVESDRRRSAVSFGLEAWADRHDFLETPLALFPLAGGIIRFPQVVEYTPGEQAGVWRTINGLRVKSAGAQSFTFKTEARKADPLAPTMAVAGIDGLPPSGFLRLALDKPMTKARKVLVVLVDDRGQRYTIWENFGADYYGSRSDIWLNLEDFHADFWGPCSADYRFRPERIREVHLRFYLNDPGDAVQVGLSVLKSKEH